MNKQEFSEFIKNNGYDGKEFRSICGELQAGMAHLKEQVVGWMPQDTNLPPIREDQRTFSEPVFRSRRREVSESECFNIPTFSLFFQAGQEEREVEFEPIPPLQSSRDVAFSFLAGARTSVIEVMTQSLDARPVMFYLIDTRAGAIGQQWRMVRVERMFAGHNIGDGDPGELRAIFPALDWNAATFYDQIVERVYHEPFRRVLLDNTRAFLVSRAKTAVFFIGLLDSDKLGKAGKAFGALDELVPLAKNCEHDLQDILTGCGLFQTGQIKELLTVR